MGLEFWRSCVLVASSDWLGVEGGDSYLGSGMEKDPQLWRVWPWGAHTSVATAFS